MTPTPFLELPGGQKLFSPEGLNPNLNSLGGIISAALDLAILAAAVLMFFWMIWGVFQYIYAGGDKESLGHARKRITMALVGFIITILALAMSQFARTIIPFRDQRIQTISVPPTPTP